MASIEQLKRLLEPVFKKHGVTVAHLFGSVARDSAGPKSDTDIAVVFRDSEPDVEKRIIRDSALSSELEDKIDGDVNLIDLEEVTAPLLRHRAIRRGELIYCTDHKRRQRLELKALHDYEDTRHLRAIQSKALKQRIKEGSFGKPL